MGHTQPQAGFAESLEPPGQAPHVVVFSPLPCAAVTLGFIVQNVLAHSALIPLLVPMPSASVVHALAAPVPVTVSGYRHFWNWEDQE